MKLSSFVVSDAKFPQIFDEVWDEIPSQLQEQKNTLIETVKKYGENYPLDNHQDMK